MILVANIVPNFVVDAESGHIDHFVIDDVKQPIDVVGLPVIDDATRNRFNTLPPIWRP